MVWHRQSGKTTFAINQLVKEMVINPGVYLYIAPEKSQAKNIVWNDPTVLFRYLPEELIDKKNEVELKIQLKKTLTRQEATQKGIRWNEAYSTLRVEGADSPDRLRGLKPKGIILDEYAQMKPEVWNEILFPAINQSGGWVIFIGTFKGKNHFYDFFSKYYDWQKGEALVDDNYSTSYLPYDKNPDFTEAQIKLARESMPKGQFNQEYACIPMSGVSSVFPAIDNLMTGSLKEPNRSHYYSMGVDLAKSSDYTSVSIIDKNTNELVYQERWQADWMITLEKLILIRNRYNRAALVLDSTGVGDPISELLAKRGVRGEDFKFSNKSKDQLVRKMSVFFSESKIILPSKDQIQNLAFEIEQFSYEILSSGNIRYSAPSGKHDDEVMSLGLSIWGLKDQKELSLYAQTSPKQNIQNLDPYK